MLAEPALTKTLARLVYLLALYPAFFPPLYSLTEWLRQTGILDRFTRYYRDDVIDMPRDYLIGMTGLEARVGRIQCAKLTGQINARRTYARHYKDHLAGIPGLAFIDAPEGSSYSHIAARVHDRQHVMKAALKHGVQLGEVIEYSVPEMAAYRRYRRENAQWPVAQTLSRQTINLPVSGRFDESVAAKVVTVMRQVLKDAPPPSALPTA